MFFLLLQTLKLLFFLLIDHVSVLQGLVSFEFDEFLKGKFAQFNSGMGGVMLMVIMIMMMVAIGSMLMWLRFRLLVIMVAVGSVLVLVFVLMSALVIMLVLVLVIAFTIFAAEEGDLLSH
jgi:hypothetical protein